jgi:hypothetical protein
MRLTRLGSCYGGSCPTIYASDRGTIVVQGRLLDDNDVTTADVIPSEGEALVEIPVEVLLAAQQATATPSA